MIAVDTSGVPAYVAWLEQQIAAVQVELRVAYRTWAIRIHAEITELSPQWTGNLAANWALDIGSASTQAQDLGDPSVKRPGESGGHAFSPYSRGMEPAVSISLARAQGLTLPKLSDDLFIHNPVEYAEGVENDLLDPRVRPINRLPRAESGKIAMVMHAYAKYSVMSTPYDEL